MYVFQVTTPAVTNPDAVAARARTFVWLNALAMAATLALGVAYVAMNNTSAAKGFAIKKLEQRIADLEEQKKTLNLEAVRSQTMKSIDARIAELGLVPVTGVQYVDGGPGIVALK